MRSKFSLNNKSNPSIEQEDADVSTREGTVPCMRSILSVFQIGRYQSAKGVGFLHVLRECTAVPFICGILYSPVALAASECCRNESPLVRLW